MSKETEIKVNVDEARMEAVRKARVGAGGSTHIPNFDALDPGAGGSTDVLRRNVGLGGSTHIPNFDSIDKPTKKMKKPSLTVAEKKELTERFGGMSPEELDFIIDLIPVEYCFNRIQRELDKAKDFENRVKSAMASLG